MYNTANSDSSCLDIQPYTPPPPPGCQDSFPTFKVETPSVVGSLPIFKYHHQPNPRKKRTKLIRLDNSCSTSSGVNVTKPKYGKKPDPTAPKITRPCSECGKKFWSWKALFGHMRCHPERLWRGINPPPNFRRIAVASESYMSDYDAKMTEEDHEVASCLLMLAHGPIANIDQSPSVTTAGTVVSQGILEMSDIVTRDAATGIGDVEVAGLGPSSTANCRFECSSCKKVFGSRQALGGHRASHKNVKGCFAITRNDGEEEDRIGGVHGDVRHCQGELVKVTGEDNKMLMILGHQCSICLRVFSSGQALGGHKRCHWEKVDEPELMQGPNFFAANEGCGLDLNLPAPVDDEFVTSYSSGLELDLRLRL